MPAFFSDQDPDFEARFEALVSAKREDDADVTAAAAEIVAQVRASGDDALIALTERFDRLALTPETLALSTEEIAKGAAQAAPEAREALALAATRIEAYHRRQLPADAQWEDEAGVVLGWRWTPVDAAGLYVPGGRASYPSSVLMNAIPAKVAGVRRLAICAPAPEGQLNPLVLAAAELVGVTEIYRIGGAQAIAALAYGTGRIAPVDVVVGPGNAYVAAAKRLVFGKVGIDSVAGPSEVVVVADETANADWVATDLLAQAEHDPVAQSIAIVISSDPAQGARIAEAVEARLATLERREIAGASWRDFGAVIRTADLGRAAELVDRLAPEHLELALADPRAFARRVRHAGAIFLGAHTPEALGDYVAGPNHVLPTARSARHASGLSVLDFMKRTTLLEASPAALAALAPAAEALAKAEGLGAHALSLAIRRNSEGGR